MGSCKRSHSMHSLGDTPSSAAKRGHLLPSESITGLALLPCWAVALLQLLAGRQALLRPVLSSFPVEKLLVSRVEKVREAEGQTHPSKAPSLCLILGILLQVVSTLAKRGSCLEDPWF